MYPTSFEELYALVGAYLGAAIVIALVIIILNIIAMWKIFTKANEKGWKALIPIYNKITYYKVSGVSPFLYLVIIILSVLTVMNNNVVNIIAIVITAFITIYQTYHLAKSFGKKIGYTIGLIFLNPIFLLILGFGDAKYQEN